MSYQEFLPENKVTCLSAGGVRSWYVFHLYDGIIARNFSGVYKVIGSPKEATNMFWWRGEDLEIYLPDGKPFYLTIDQESEVMIALRFLSGLPIVFLGEAGCGKLEAISLYCRIS
eukprot:PhF_6_TR24621/c0_g1_i1/m.33886